ncbi:MAG: DUF3168 domain-containing protein [Rhodoglobus sp.]|nr:DUF3168 domain-containing protein [Rhodoglobus sp.]
MLPPVGQILLDDSGVAVLTTRVFRHGSAPQRAQAPYITWFQVTGVPENLLDGSPRVDRCEVQVDCWSENTGNGSRGIETLARAVRDALEPVAHMTAVVADEQDVDTQRYRIGMQFTFWNDREEDPLP